MKNLLFLLISIMTFSQVGIKTTQPTATLDVNGNLRVRKVIQGSISDSILVVNNGYVKKIALSQLQINSNTCPNLSNTSTGYYLLFTSTSSIPNPNSSLTISGKNFVSAGTWISNNTYYYSYSNTTGQPINVNNFSVDFTNLHCTYH